MRRRDFLTGMTGGSCLPKASLSSMDGRAQQSDKTTVQTVQLDFNKAELIEVIKKAIKANQRGVRNLVS